ncbi:glycoside hydrolase family 5 protein [Treponema sp.]|uniref:glycoside hydrolase family 5 protein n=1 Tax=Treponema sp. TaxID=166 RepID=UPI0025D33C87|nr:glycoside hydrolase family 5 protein [Treponema sp.]MCR5218295.1 glycoside hydrolase family 5 protein [Treponema sp.]
MKIKLLAATLLSLSFMLVFNSCLGNAEKESPQVIPEDLPDGTLASDLTSIQFALKMQAGWNLGNTLDASSTGDKNNKGLSTETSWGMPATTRQMINAVAEAGFRTIRIPVSWHNHIIDSNLTIDPQWLARVKEITDWALDKNMFVILNIHHDNITSSQLANTYGYTLNTNSSEQEESLKYIKAVWKQLAEYFKDYDQHLIFEVLNEPRNRDGENDGFAIPSNLSQLNGIIASYNQAALNEIRSTGSGNSQRFIMLPYYATSACDYSGWSLPSDTASDKLLISVHAYCPYDFCMSNTSDSTFEESDEGSSIDWLFNTIKNQWVSKGYGVVMGETSASDKNNLSERLEWFDYYYKAAKKNKVAVILWDNMVISSASGGQGDINSGECHGYLNRTNQTWYFPAIIEKIMSVTN